MKFAYIYRMEINQQYFCPLLPWVKKHSGNYNAENKQRKLSNVDSAFCACFRWLMGILCTDRTHHLKRRSPAGSRGYSKCQPLSILHHWMFTRYAEKQNLVLLILMRWHFTGIANCRLLLWVLTIFELITALCTCFLFFLVILGS